MSPFTCDPQALQYVKDALIQDPRNGGIGILHQPKAQIHLAPFDDVDGHAKFAIKLNLPRDECQGFAIYLDSDGTFTVLNVSELNGPLGQPGSLQMPEAIFEEIVQTLVDAGL